MSAAEESLVRVLSVIEELLRNRPQGSRPVDANMVLERMHLGQTAKDDVAQTMSALWERGDVQGPAPLTGDNKVLDVDVTAITDQGRRRLQDK